MKKNEIKEKLETFYEWQKEAVGDFTETHEIVEGIWVDITYETSLVYGDYDFYVSSAVGTDDKTKKIIEVLHEGDFENSDVVQDRIREYLSGLSEEANAMYAELLDCELGVDLDDLSFNYDNFDNLWEDVEENLEDQEVVVKLTNQYSAVMKKGFQTVTVGCQEIHIDKIREVVAAFNELNNE